MFGYNDAVADACESDACANGGSCIATSPAGYVCVCRAGFTGPTCLTGWHVTQIKLNLEVEVA
jgi:hypothetical protein